MTAPKYAPVSVIIPMYRAEHVIQKTIDALVTQTLLPTEVIFVDDGSPDDCASVVNRFLATNPPFKASLIRQTNGGPAKGRNTGIRASTQPLIAFLDQDDIWYPQKLERCVATLTALPPQYVGVYHRFQLHYPDGRKEPGKFLKADGDVYEALIKENNFIANSTTLLRRSWLEKVEPLDEAPQMIAVEDFDLWLRLAAVGSWYGIDECLMDYTAEVGYSTKSFRRQRVHNSNLLLKHLKNNYRPLPMSMKASICVRALNLRLHAKYLGFKMVVKRLLTPTSAA